MKRHRRANIDADEVARSVVREELREMRRVLSHFRRRYPENLKVIAACSRSVAAFENLNADPLARRDWWDSFSDEGRRLMSSTVAR